MDLIACIAEQAERVTKPSLDGLSGLLRAFPDLAEPASLYVTEPDRYAYGRNVLYRNRELEFILIHLPARCRTSIHDHGASSGCAAVIEGELTNIVYRMADARLRESEVSRVRAGELFFSPHGIIHQMANEGEKRVVSLHVYSPPLQAMNVYSQPE